MDQELQEELITTRRFIHQHPELGWQEKHTAETVEAFLDKVKTPHRRVAKTGVIADLPGEADGPIIALRADMDALPIQEETNLTFASKYPGKMHACGHDGHTTILLGAAALLSESPRPPLPIRLLFQPAEELGQGAKAMIEAGALDDVAMAFGAHLDPHYPVGSIIATDGAVNASSDRFTIHIHTGGGGHAARPHEATDAVVVGSLLVMTIQTIISREINPSHPSVITVGKFHAGSAHNSIANTCKMEGTIRCHDPEIRNYLKKAIERIASSIGQLHGIQIDTVVEPGTPALINQPEAVALSRAAAKEIVGEGKVWAMDFASLGAEDFAYYAQKVPSSYIRIGSQKPDTEAHPLHSSEFNFDETALFIGANYFAKIAVLAGQKLSSSPSAKKI